MYMLQDYLVRAHQDDLRRAARAHRLEQYAKTRRYRRARYRHRRHWSWRLARAV